MLRALREPEDPTLFSLDALGLTYPSGGQCQRIAIARALALEPDIIAFGEAVSALDVSIRAQILGLILDLEQHRGLAYIFISRDLGVVRRVADRIAVTYSGRIVEIGAAEQLCGRPLHPYTQALLSAIPIADPRRMRVTDLGLAEGEAASPLSPPIGCSFCDRCRYRLLRCATGRPELAEVASGAAVAGFLRGNGAPPLGSR